MKTSFKLLAAGAIAVLVGVVSFSASVSDAPTVSAASSDYFLKIEGIDGEIAIESFSWGVSSPRDAASGQATGKRQYQPLIIRKQVDKASPLLFRLINDGKGNNIKRVTLGRPPSDGKAGYTVVFDDVNITLFQEQGDLGSSPIENLSFVYQKVELK